MRLDADDEHVYSLGIPNSCILPIPACEVRCLFGSDETGVAGVVTTNDELYCFKKDNMMAQPGMLQRYNLRTKKSTRSWTSRPILFAIAGNGRTVATCRRRKDDIMTTLIITSPTIEDMVDSVDSINTASKKVSHHIRPGQSKQLLGNASAFVMLMEDGTV